MKFLISILSLRMDAGVERCIESIRRAGGDYKLHLTSNGSPEVAAYFTAQSRGEDTDVARIVINRVNEGFIGPGNYACAWAIAMGYTYFVMVNDDCTVPRGWLDTIEAEFERHPAAAIVGADGGCRTLTFGMHGYLGADLDYIECSCAAVKVAVIAKHFGTLFHPGLRFCYCEDASLSLEVRRRGYTIRQAPFRIEHSRGATRKHVPEAAKSEEENRAFLLKRYAHWNKVRTFVHRIIVKRKWSIGDVLLTTPIIRALWNENPLCSILVETDCPDVFDGNPCVLGAAKHFDRRADDQVIDLDMASENAPLRHFVTSYARMAGVDLAPPFKTEIYWRRDPFANLDWGGRWAALHTGPSTWAAKEWAADKWNDVICRLRAAGWRVMLVGNGKLSGVGTVDRDFRDQTKTVNELAALLSHADLFIGIDSFPMHCAQAVGVAAIGLFGITDSRYIMTDGSAHVGLDADPLLFPRAGERHRSAGLTMVTESGECVNSISADRVMEAVTALEARNSIPV